MCLLCYLKQTICFGLQIYHSHTHSLQAFLEVDWVGYRDDRHSIIDCCIFFLDVNLIYWGCKKQATVAWSNIEAEYKALANTAAKVKWLCSLLSKLSASVTTCPVLWCDNIGATYLSSYLVFHACTKQIEIDFHFVRAMVAVKFVTIWFLSRKDQLANIFTKPVFL